MTVILRGLDIVSTLLILPQHRQAEVLYEISELCSGWHPIPAATVLMAVMTVVAVMISSIAKDACKSNKQLST